MVFDFVQSAALQRGGDVAQPQRGVEALAAVEMLDEAADRLRLARGD